jgi:hypothetical protein
MALGKRWLSDGGTVVVVVVEMERESGVLSFVEGSDLRNGY